MAENKAPQGRAKRGVVFASGGFTHNLSYRQTYLKGPVFGGCAVPSCEGDLIPIGMSVGAAFGNMTNAWWAECVAEDALVTPSFGQTLFLASGRSMIYVNRLGGSPAGLYPIPAADASPSYPSGPIYWRV